MGRVFEPGPMHDAELHAAMARCLLCNGQHFRDADERAAALPRKVANVFWLHAPKCGSSFVAVIAHTACPRIPPEETGVCAVNRSLPWGQWTALPRQCSVMGSLEARVRTWKKLGWADGRSQKSLACGSEPKAGTLNGVLPSFYARYPERQYCAAGFRWHRGLHTPLRAWGPPAAKPAFADTAMMLRAPRQVLCSIERGCRTRLVTLCVLARFFTRSLATLRVATASALGLPRQQAPVLVALQAGLQGARAAGVARGGVHPASPLLACPAAVLMITSSPHTRITYSHRVAARRAQVAVGACNAPTFARVPGLQGCQVGMVSGCALCAHNESARVYKPCVAFCANATRVMAAAQHSIA
jgi:hypothetical protein